MLDLSHKADLVWLGRLVADVRVAAPEADFLVAGAQARDLLLMHAHGIETGRATEDVDLAFLVASWDEFMSLREGLLGSGKFITETQTLHKLRHTGIGKARLDLIPFAGIETDDRHISWPPNGEPVMNVIGFREAHAAAVQVALPELQPVAVVALHALMLLKLSAWKDRRLQHPIGKDAHDIRLLLKTYLDAGNQERLYSEAAHLLDRDDFDYEVAGAWLLGYDAGNLLPTEETPGNAKDFYRTLLRAEVAAEMESTLIIDMRTADPTAEVQLLRSLFEGFSAADTL